MLGIWIRDAEIRSRLPSRVASHRSLACTFWPVHRTPSVLDSCSVCRGVLDFLKGHRAAKNHPGQTEVCIEKVPQTLSVERSADIPITRCPMLPEPMIAITRKTTGVGAKAVPSQLYNYH